MATAAFERFDHLADTLLALAAGFNQDGRSHSNSLAESLFFVTDWIKQEVTEFTGDAPVVTSPSTPSAPSWGEFTGTVDLLLTDVLLAIQSMVNQVKGQRSMEGEGCSGEEDDGEEEEGKNGIYIQNMYYNLIKGDQKNLSGMLLVYKP